MFQKSTIHRRLLALFIALSVLVLCSAQSALGAQDADGSSQSAAGEAPFNHLLPAEIQSRGYLRVASEIMYPPFETFAKDNKTVVGIDADIAKAIGKQLGVELRFISTSFDAIIPGLAANRYDMAMSAMTDNTKRQKQVDFVDYFLAGGAIMARTADKDKYVKLVDLCGVAVGVTKGTTEVSDAKEQSTKCEKAGKSPLDISIFARQAQMVLALQSNRVDAVMADAPNAAATADHSEGQLELTGPPYEKAVFGIVFPKDSDQLLKAVQAALQEIMDNGAYVAILEQYGQAKNALDTATINAGK